MSGVVKFLSRFCFSCANSFATPHLANILIIIVTGQEQEDHAEIAIGITRRYQYKGAKFDAEFHSRANQTIVNAHNMALDDINFTRQTDSTLLDYQIVNG